MTLDTPPTYSIRRAIAVGGGGLAVCMLPVFLTGALAVQLTEDLQFGSAGLGLAIATHRLASAPASIVGGRLADRLGASRSLRVAALIAAAACLGIALFAHDLVTLAAWMAIAGLSLALAEPAANRLLVNVVPPQRLGTAFGVKQSATPAATMLAGLSVPLLALTLGWRVAFGLAAAACLAVLAGVGRVPRSPKKGKVAPRIRLNDPVTIVLLSTAMGFNTATSSTVPAFYVTSAVSAGTAVTKAGTILAAASIATIAVRMMAGAVADRMKDRHLRLSIAGQLAGLIGLGLLATLRPSLMGIGAVIALAGTWGFHGVFWFAMVRAYPRTPGAITGAVAPGALLGGVVGPLLFGMVAAGYGYRTGWLLSAGLALGAAAATQLGLRRLLGHPNGG